MLETPIFSFFVTVARWQYVEDIDRLTVTIVLKLVWWNLWKW